MFDDGDRIKIQGSIWVHDQCHFDKKHIIALKVDDVNGPCECTVGITMNIFDGIVAKCMEYMLH